MTARKNETPPHKIKPISAAVRHGQKATNTTSNPRNKVTYVPAPLPLEGYVRKPSFLAVLGISNTSFNNGIKAGKIPAGKLLSPRCRVWDVAEIRAYLAELGGK